MKRYISLISLLIVTFVFSQNQINPGKYCTKNNSNCIIFFENNKYEQLINFDVITIISGTYYLNRNFLILFEDIEKNYNTKQKELNTEEIQMNEIYNNELQSNNYNDFTLFKIRKITKNVIQLILMNNNKRQKINYIKE